jgi:hypothetical protein
MTSCFRFCYASAAITSYKVNPPPVPSTIRREGNVAFLKGHAVGTQNYTCVPSNGAYGWKEPQFHLFMNLKWFNTEIRGRSRLPLPNRPKPARPNGRKRKRYQHSVGQPD